MNEGKMINSTEANFNGWGEGESGWNTIDDQNLTVYMYHCTFYNLKALDTLVTVKDQYSHLVYPNVMHKKKP